MTKQEFMNELRDYLDGLAQKTEIINDFLEHFDMAIEHGETEEQICKALGDPRAIAEMFLEEAGQKVELKDSAERVGQSRQSNYRSSKHPPEADYRSSKHPPEADEISIDERYEVANISLIAVKIKSSSLEIVGSKSAQAIHVRIEGRSRNGFIVEERNGRLEIIEEMSMLKGFAFDEQTVKDVLKYLIGNNKSNHSVNVVITVPERYSGGIDASSTAGAVRMDGLRADKIKVFCTAGSVRVYNCEGSLDINSTAGSIKIEGHNGGIKAHSSAGSVKIENASGDIKADSTAGSVKIKNGDGSIEVSSSAGSVVIESGTVYGLKAKSSAGKVVVNAEEISHGGYIGASAGSVKLSAKRIIGTLDVHSSIGNVTVHLPKNVDLKIKAENKSKKIKHEVFGNDASQNALNVNASMGSINITEL